MKSEPIWQYKEELYFEAEQYNIHQNTIVNLQMNIFIFFSGRFFLMSPLNKNPVERRTQYMAFVYCLNSVFSKNHAQRTVFESTEY